MARTGRPREFDVETVLDAALRLFWEHGYRSTTLAQLREVTGVSSASLYAAFSSKERLFETVLDRYRTTFGRVTDAIGDPDLEPRAAVELTLLRSVAMQTDTSHPSGCLLVLSLATSPLSGRIGALLTTHRSAIRAGLEACVARAVARGDLRDDVDPAALACALDTFLSGISIEARDGVSRASMEAAVHQMMGLWDAVAVPPPRAAVTAGLRRESAR